MKCKLKILRLKQSRKVCKFIAFLLVLCLMLSNLTMLNIVFAEETAKGSAIEISNMVINGGFELDFNNWKKVVASNTNPAQIEIDSTIAYEGTKSLKITNYPSPDGRVVRGIVDQEYIPLDPNKTYKLSGYIKAQNLSKTCEITMELYYFDQNKKFLGGDKYKKFVITGIEGDLNWTKCEVEVVPAPVGAYYARVRLNVNKGEGTVWFDSISLTKVVAPTELAYITVTADKTQLFVGRRATLTITGIRNDTTEADLSKAKISYKMYSIVKGQEPIEDYTLAEINEENGVITVTAKKPGTLKITVEVELDGVIKTDEVVITIESTEGIKCSKTKTTYYTEEKIAAARENIEKYDWARAIRDAAVELAEAYVDKAEFLWNIVPPQSIPRSMTVNPQYICPNCKTDLRQRYGNYPWLFNINEPWKIECPNCHAKFPTNDFESYYKLGLDSNGIFNPDLAKRRNDELIAKGEKGYLVNILYPEKGPDWGVDDGYGWLDENGVRHTFIAYYAHWGIWYSSGIIHQALNALRDAYLYTGDIRYARTGTILLDRIADVYPDMNLAVYPDSKGYRNSHGGTGQGKIIGSIWETSLVQDFIKAYDAFFPAMDDPEIIDFLMKKSEEYDLDNPKNTGDLIRKNIEDGILRQVYPAVKNAQIRGNFGMHQAALALAAVVLDSNPETKEWLDFTFQAGGLLSNPWRVTGGDILATLVDKVDRDGHGNEAAPEYNKIWLDQMLQVADVLDGYEGYPGADLYKNPKFMKMFTALYPLILAEKYTAQIGDSGLTGAPGLIESISNAVKGFIKFGDPVLAQLAYFLNNDSVEGLHGDIFMKDPESVGPRIQSIIDEYGKLDFRSNNLTGYGFAVLRDGENKKRYFGIQIPFANLNVLEASTGTKYFANSGTVQFEANKSGERISFKFQVPKTDVYEVNIKPFKATSYGIYDVYIDGEKVKTVDFYGNSGASSNLEVLTVKRLTEGEHVITFEGVGKNESATNYKMGVIHIVLYDEMALAIKNDETLSDTQRGIWMYYGRNTGHGHKDTLNIGVYAYGLDLAPDLGYPEETGTQPNRIEWVSNTVSHNTVVVDKSKQGDIFVATPIHFDDSEMVDIIDVDAKEVYPQTEMYRRTVALIKVDDEISYGVDFFRVKGGNEHHYCFHGAEGSVTTEGLNLIPQTDENGNFVGTYAGRDVEYGIRPVDDSVSGWNYKGPGFHWLKNVEKDENPGNKFSIDWDIVDTWKVLPEEMDIHLRLTMLGEFDDVAIMDGIPPKKPGNPASLKYMIAHRRGENLESTFVAIIEPYKDTRYIESINEVPVTINGLPAPADVKAVKVVLKNGRIDYIVNALDTETVYTVDNKFEFKGFFGVYSEKNGYPVFEYINDGEKIGKFTDKAQARITGEVVAFTKDLNIKNEIVIKVDDIHMAGLNPDELVGRYIYVENDKVRNAVYRIEKIKRQDGNYITLDIGNITLIRSWVDPNDFSKGFMYDISEGARFTIPLSACKEYYTITAISKEGGSITGTKTVLKGSTVTFYITPDEGYIVKDVLVNGKSVGAVESYTFENVTANAIIEAVFVPAGEEGPDKPEEPGDPDELGEQPGERPEEQPAERPEQQPGEQPSEQPAERPEQQPGEQPSEQPEEQEEERKLVKTGLLLDIQVLLLVGLILVSIGTILLFLERKVEKFTKI